MVAHSALFVRPLVPPSGGGDSAGVSNAPARLKAAPESSPPSRVRLVVAPRRGAALDDAALVRATLAGDPHGPPAIWARFAPLVRAKLTRSIGAQDMEDQVQEVFMRLFEYLDQLRDPDALRSFIIGITLRIAGTELRRRRCRSWLTLTATGDVPEMPADDDIDARRVVARLFTILDKLAPENSRVFELRYIEEKELTEVAVAMNVSLATAKRYLARVSARVHAMAEREPMLAGYVGARS
ncbi:MAG: sigma-70 family RNA polymerase sigma factor [Polyangiaceae bacterium]|nr:sigma-70 family RNA polymerase sigma factor [Polyangiaceae bacterium]